MPNTIASLRDIVPFRPLTVIEAVQIAELQANRFRALTETTTLALPETAISELPRVQVDRMFPAPSAGASQWTRGRWLILLNGADPVSRQRFSLAHEFKHVLDDPFKKILYPPIGGQSEGERREAICDYFASCLLMPRTDIKRAWCGGTQEIRTLAHRFDVSLQAMRIRLTQLGLIDPQPRHV